MTNYALSFGAKNVQKTKFEAAEMILDTWNQQLLGKEIRQKRPSELSQLNFLWSFCLCTLVQYGSASYEAANGSKMFRRNGRSSKW